MSGAICAAPGCTNHLTGRQTRICAAPACQRWLNAEYVRECRQRKAAPHGDGFPAIEAELLELRRAGRLDFEHAVLGAVVAHGVAA